MQTFLPFPSFTESLCLLDKRRLNKQNVESTQILNILLGRSNSKAWQNHPAVNMWRGYENALKSYKNIGMQIGATERGIKYKKLQLEEFDPFAEIILPPLIGNVGFHQSHLANLKRKALEDFRKGRQELYNNMVRFLGMNKFDEIDEGLPYIWG